LQENAYYQVSLTFGSNRVQSHRLLGTQLQDC
jgi:hypothetical protein